MEAELYHGREKGGKGALSADDGGGVVVRRWREMTQEGGEEKQGEGK